MSESIAQHAPPVAPKHDTVLVKHGHERIDEYYWLNDRENPEVIAYLAAENAYKDARLAGQTALRETLFEEIVARIKPDDESVPFLDRGYLYAERHETGKEHPIYTRRKGGPKGDEEVMLEVNALAEPYDYYNVGTRAVSDDNRLLVYAEDTRSRRIYTLRVKDLDTGEMLPDVIVNTAGNVVWAADNETFFYTRKDEALRPYKVFRHVLGTPTAQDVEVFHESDDTFYMGIGRTTSRDYLIIQSSATLTSEVQYLRADDPTGAFQTFESRDRMAKLEYDVDHLGDKWYVRTNKNAVNFKICTTPVGKTGMAHWRDLVAARDEAFVEGMELFNDYLVVSERVGGIVRQSILPQDAGGAFAKNSSCRTRHRLRRESLLLCNFDQ